MGLRGRATRRSKAAAATDYERELRHESTTPDYFRTLGTRLVRGRWLTEADRPPKPAVTLVNETLAKRYFRGEDAIGKRISFGKPTDKPALGHDRRHRRRTSNRTAWTIRCSPRSTCRSRRRCRIR